MAESYRFTWQGGTGEIVEKKSRFIATVAPVKSEEEALSFIEHIRKQYWDARHSCTAFTIGSRHQLTRCSDDGEPAGTAGRPMLDVLLGENIHDTCAVVTRYFGGTLLGTGGLVRAYGRCARLGIEAAGIARVKHYKECSVSTDYTTSGKIQYEITKGEYILEDTVYTDKVEFIVLLDSGNEKKFSDMISEATLGRSDVITLREIYGAWVNGELKEV